MPANSELLTSPAAVGRPESTGAPPTYTAAPRTPTGPPAPPTPLDRLTYETKISRLEKQLADTQTLVEKQQASIQHSLNRSSSMDMFATTPAVNSIAGRTGGGTITPAGRPPGSSSVESLRGEFDSAAHAAADACAALRRERDQQQAAFALKTDELFLKTEQVKTLEKSLKEQTNSLKELEKSLRIKEEEWKTIFRDMERGQLSLLESLEAEAVERARALEKRLDEKAAGELRVGVAAAVEAALAQEREVVGKKREREWKTREAEWEAECLKRVRQTEERVARLVATKADEEFAQKLELEARAAEERAEERTADAVGAAAEKFRRELEREREQARGEATEQERLAGEQRAQGLARENREALRQLAERNAKLQELERALGEEKELAVVAQRRFEEQQQEFGAKVREMQTEHSRREAEREENHAEALTGLRKRLDKEGLEKLREALQDAEERFAGREREFQREGEEERERLGERCRVAVAAEATRINGMWEEQVRLANEQARLELETALKARDERAIKEAGELARQLVDELESAKALHLKTVAALEQQLQSEKEVAENTLKTQEEKTEKTVEKRLNLLRQELLQAHR